MTTEEAASNQKAISSEEVALYDRQIRLWGMEAQTRMRNSRVLVVNVGALANEIIKNIVLAGIGSLTVLDPHTVTASDLGAQFFINDDCVGKNRAEAALPAIQKLNPRVTVTADTGALFDKDADWFAQFDVTLGTQLTYPEIEYINTHTSRSTSSDSSHRLFYAASITGFYGFCFADLGDSYNFTIQQERATTGLPSPGPESRTRSIVSVTPATSKEGSVITDTILKSEKYVPISRLVVSPEAPIPISLGPLFETRRRALKVSTLLLVVLAVFHLEESKKGLTADTIKAAALEYARILKLPTEILTDNVVETFLNTKGAEISPVAAVVGGVVAQQILNAISRKQQPLQNLLIFDGVSSTGPVYTLA